MRQMKHRLRKKMIAMVITVALLLSLMACGVSYAVYRNSINNRYTESAENLSQTLADAIDKEQVKELRDTVMDIYKKICEKYGGTIPFDSFTEEEMEAYYEEFQPVYSMPVYEKLSKQLKNYGDINDLYSLYIGYTDVETGYGIYLVDASDDPSPVGNADPVEDVTLEAIREGSYGFPPNITNYPEYGWLCSVGDGIYDADGSVLGTLCIDISMDEVMANTFHFLFFLGCIMLLATAVLLIPIAISMDRMVVKPINQLSKAADRFISEKNEVGTETRISKVEVHTGDEIERLCNSMKKMETDIEAYIHNVTALTAEKERIGAELDVATKIQSQMLPCIFPAFPDRSEIEIYASMTPAREVGGDFYDFFMVDPDHLALVMADVSGKGVPAALFMVVSRTLIKNTTLDGASPEAVLEKVNSQLCDNNSAEMFVTVWLGIITLSTGKMVCANAGHEFPAICRKGRKYELFRDKHGFVLGGMEGMRYREYEIQMEQGDRLFLYTDGVPEATNGEIEMLGTERMLTFLNRDPDRKPETLLKEIKADIDAFVGDAPQFDDLTMLAFVYNGHKMENIDTAERKNGEEKENG